MVWVLAEESSSGPAAIVLAVALVVVTSIGQYIVGGRLFERQRTLADETWKRQRDEADKTWARQREEADRAWARQLEQADRSWERQRAHDRSLWDLRERRVQYAHVLAHSAKAVELTAKMRGNWSREKSQELWGVAWGMLAALEEVRLIGSSEFVAQAQTVAIELLTLARLASDPGGDWQPNREPPTEPVRSAADELSRIGREELGYPPLGPTA